MPFYEKMLQKDNAKNILLNSVDTVDEVVEILDDFKNLYDIMGAHPYRDNRASYTFKKFQQSKILVE